MAEPVPEVLMVGMGDLVMAVELGVVVEATVEKWVVQVLVVWVAAEAEVAEVVAAANLAMGGAISADSGDQTGQDSNISLLWITEIHLRD